jgi:group I intron endonuclease
MNIIGIYKITNPKGKIYVGQSVNIDERKLQYKNLNAGVEKQPKIYNSIKKYGWENHIFEILEECSLDQLDEKEVYWGIYFDVLGKKGLVLRLGKGKGMLNEDLKKQISQKHKGMKKPWAGKNMKLTEEHKYKLKNGRESVLNPIYQYNMDGVFIKKWQNAKQASTDLCINNGWLSFIKDDIYKSLGGYRWTSKFYDKLPPITKNFNSKKPILQYDIDGNFIKEWGSAKEAASALKTHVQNITACCRQELKSSAGFIFKFKN